MDEEMYPPGGQPEEKKPKRLGPFSEQEEELDRLMADFKEDAKSIPERPEQPKKDAEDKISPFRDAAMFINIPFVMLACAGLGYLLGSFIENKIKAGGAFIAIFSLLGIAAGFYEVIMMVKKNAEK